MGIYEILTILYVAIGLLSEVETQLLLAKRLAFINESKLLNDIESIRRMLLGLIKFLKRIKMIKATDYTSRITDYGF